MLTGFDHFILLVNDLAAALETYRRLGFDARAGGAHPAFGSRNALVAFADGTYLELLAFDDAALAARTFWRNAVRKHQAGEGFGGYVLASADLVSDVARLRARGLAVSEPHAGTRLRPDGARVAWHTALIGETPVGALPFLIQDDTPRPLRIEPAREGLGCCARVREIVVAVENVDAACAQYRALLEVEPKRVRNRHADVEGYRLTSNWGTIVLARPLRAGNALADQLMQRGAGLYALTLEVAGLARARRTLRQRGIVIQDDGAGFLIAPAFTCGARIRLI